ncbi:MAG: bifunctional DNA-formamidopyrimidine glycosylase/DNA-(apurinic or apyrimidinic site) lyase [Verrucomicrobia bacterium]|jgi:formamidopyrimidine-DNA glycosylase|nr:bifunctional DNA-formamidopyrimidine glycosylase/DNA-(apurinic or apyrimidinic site) lyase [Verrucomicrobiota bacterium]
MPELPEVETVVRDLLRAGVVGSTISGARNGWPRTLQGISLRTFRKRVVGARILDVQRRAKYIVIPLTSRQWLLIHLRMTGRLHIEGADQPVSSHERAALQFADGRELRFVDTRKFGRWRLVRDIDTVLGDLGPEPLAPGFTAKHLHKILQSRRRTLKPLLLDQHVIAGLGNIYVDEALWEAGIHPCRISSTLASADAQRLHSAIRTVLRRGIRSMGTSLGTGKGNFYSVAGRRGRNQDGLRVFRRHGEACPRCEATLERLVVGQRSTHICPTCQVMRKG